MSFRKPTLAVHWCARLRRGLASVLVGGLATGLLVSCGGTHRPDFDSANSLPSPGGILRPNSSAGGTGAAASAGIPEIRSEIDLGADRAFPVDAYALSTTQASLIGHAVYLIEVQCMTKLGFTMPPYQNPVATDTPIRNPLVVMFGVGILSEVTQYGYDAPPKYVGPQKSDTPADPDPSTADPAYVRALLGAPTPGTTQSDVPVGGGFEVSGLPQYTSDSCGGRAYAALGANPIQSVVEGGSSAVAKLATDSLAQTYADHAALDVDQKWSSCMAVSGFTVTTPGAAANTYGPGVKSLAIAAATADVKCKYQTNYFGVMYALEVAYQKADIAKDLTTFNTLIASNSSAIAKANAVIQGK